jgi:hypothetical protein
VHVVLQATQTTQKRYGGPKTPKTKNMQTNPVNTPIILLFSVFKSMFSFWLTQSSAFDSSKQNTLLLLTLEQENHLVDWDCMQTINLAINK